MMMAKFSNLPIKPKGSESNIKVAGWVEFEKPWKVTDVCEWTYKRDEGDLVIFARTAAEALATIEAHGFTNLDHTKLAQTSGRLTDYLKKSEIK